MCSHFFQTAVIYFQEYLKFLMKCNENFSERKMIKQFGTPPFNYPPISEQFFHNPPLCPKCVCMCVCVCVWVCVEETMVVPFRYSNILNISQYNHWLSTTIFTLLNLKDKRSKLQKLGWIYLMVKPVTELSIPMPILRLNFITNIYSSSYLNLWYSWQNS